MKRHIRRFALFLALAMLVILTQKSAYATASTHIWAPSTDTQAFGTAHVGEDVYVPVESNRDGSRARTITDSGLTVGLLPFKKLNLEAGVDLKTGYGDLDSWPVYFNAKLAIPEDSYGKFFPALAAGVYDAGTRRSKTDYNIAYLEAAKTFKIKDFDLGRFSFGYFWGNRHLLLDKDGDINKHGVIASWERTMTEISDKLWVCVEYQGTESVYGAFNLGFQWQFTKNISAIAGYQFYNNKNYADTVTVQADINF